MHALTLLFVLLALTVGLVAVLYAVAMATNCRRRRMSRSSWYFVTAVPV